MIKAVVVVDAQKGFVTKYSKHIIPRIKQLLARGKFKYVLFTQFVNRKNSSFRKIMRWERMKTSPEIDIVTELKPYAKRVFTKNNYTAFTPSFLRYLQKYKIKKLYVVGIDTECCVLKTAVDAFEKGFTPYVLIYYCASHSSPSWHRKGITLLEKYIGKRQVPRGKYD